jgi:hypothetical protein
MLTFQLGQGNIPNPNQELDLNQKLATDASSSLVAFANRKLSPVIGDVFSRLGRAPA